MQDYLHGAMRWFIDAFGGMSSWEDQGYSRKDASRHRWIRTGVYIAAVTIFSGQVLHGNAFSLFTSLMALAPIVVWAYFLADHRDMPLRLYPKPYREKVRADEGSRIIPGERALGDTNPANVPFHRSIGDALDAMEGTDSGLS